MRKNWSIAFAFVWLCLGTEALARSRQPKPRLTTFRATAHSVEGTTASGIPSQPGTVAADPAVLPLGSRIRVHGAGKYSGEYTVADTGAKVRGRKIDIYLPSAAEAKRFGNKRVKVQILSKAEGKR